MVKCREVLRLALMCLLDPTEISKSCNIDRKTVVTYIKRVKSKKLCGSDIAKLSDTELMEILKNKRGRPQKKGCPAPDFEYIHIELQKKGVTCQILWEEYIAQNPTGYQRTQFFNLYKEWRSHLNPSMRQSHKGGDSLFVDYSGLTLPIKNPQTGETSQAEIFVAVLGASRYTYAEASLSQTLEDWINSHIRAFEYFNGVPAVVVPDNLKSGVTKACRYDPEANREYREMAEFYGTAINPARSYCPQDKSHAENGVCLVQRWIIAALRHRTFFGIYSANQGILELLTRLNNRPFNKLSGTRLSLFQALDQPHLKPLPQIKYSYASWKWNRIGKDYHFELSGHFYSVPYKYANKKVAIRYNQQTVEVFFNNKRIASHKRDNRSGEQSTLPAHMPESHRQHLAWTPSKLFADSQNIGPSTFFLVKKLFRDRPHPSIAIRAATGILRLAKSYSEERLEAACLRAIRIEGFTYTSIKSILSNGLDRQEIMPPPKTAPLDHKNIRGADYYSPAPSHTDGDLLC